MENINIIQETVNEVLKVICVEGQVSANYNHSNECVLVNIHTDQSNSGFLIGQGGSNLDSFQHIIRLLVNKKVEQPVKFILDVNDYRRHRLDLLKTIAIDIAKQVVLRKTALALRPMPAYERRIIHLALSDHPLIDTESVGDEPERRIIVKIRSDI